MPKDQLMRVSNSAYNDKMRFLAAAALPILIACGAEAGASYGEGRSLHDCAGLYGKPGANTGLDEDICRPYCERADETREDPAPISLETLKSAAALRLDNPKEKLQTDPYLEPPPIVAPGLVCGVESTDAGASYKVSDFASLEALREAGAILTHRGPCGLCSSLSDLLVYVENPDLATPVRECGLLGISAGEEATLSCLEELGFSPGCAQIWAYNTTHTRQVCLEPCLAALNDPYHEVDGSPNDCIACDEQMSGDVFKAYAGRTRRNTGLASALCRPWSEVMFIEHDYRALL